MHFSTCETLMIAAEVKDYIIWIRCWQFCLAHICKSHQLGFLGKAKVPPGAWEELMGTGSTGVGTDRFMGGYVGQQAVCFFTIPSHLEH